MHILLYLGIGLGVGFVSGILGIGGGVLLMPALTWLCGMDYRLAAGTTLAVLVVPVVLPAAWEYYAADNVNVVAAAWIAAPFAVGGYLGAVLAQSGYLPVGTLRLGFGLLLLYMATRLIVNSTSETANALAGLLMVACGWLVYLRLRLLGRRHLNRPDLGKQIRISEEKGGGEPDYYI